MAQADEQRRAAELAYTRRQSAALNQSRASSGMSGVANKTTSAASSFSPTGLIKSYSFTSGKPLEQQLREKGGREAGRWLGGLLGSYVPVLGTAAGALFGGWLGKKLGGSIFGKIFLIILVIGTLLSLAFFVFMALFTVCSHYKWLISTGGNVNEQLNIISNLCTSLNL